MKPYWSISETCVWAATLDLDAVDAVNERQPDGAHWLFGYTPPVGYDCHVLEWRRRSLERVGRTLPDTWEAFNQLRPLCGDGLLTMYGIPRDEGGHEPIPCAAWAGVEITHSETRGCFVADIHLALGNPGACWWTWLRLRSADVQRIWPPIDAPIKQPPAGDDAKPRKPTYDEIRAWFVDRVAQHPPGRLPPSRYDDEWDAREFFNAKGLNGRGIRTDVRKARKEVAPSAWQESGAKPSDAYEADRKAKARASAV